MRCLLQQAFEVIEFFCGTGHVGRSTRMGMHTTAQLDIEFGQGGPRHHHQNAFDMRTAAGLAFPSCIIGAPLV